MTEEANRITGDVIGAAIAVHRVLGPGLLESAYQACLAYELAERGRNVERQVLLPVTYRGVRIDAGYRIDLLVERRVVVELKAGRAKFNVAPTPRASTKHSCSHI